jgi:hypothetical protein
MGCEAESWSPEVVALYGDPDTVLRKLSSYDMDLPNRRIYISLIEGKEESEISLFEKTSDKGVTISRWTSRPSPELHEKIAGAIVDNKGVYCVGEQTRAILNTLGKPQQTEDATIPANARAAFSHRLRAMSDDYIRSTFYLMC